TTRTNVRGAQINTRRQTVGHRRAADTVENAPHVRVIAAYDGETIERQVVQEVDEAALQALEVAAVCDEMIVVDIRDDRDERLQVRERRVALVCFRDEILAGAQTRIAVRA